MNLNEIQDLIKFVAKSGVNEVEIEKDDFKITIKSDYMARKKGGIKTTDQPTVIQATTVPVAQPVVASAPALASVAAAEAPAPVAENGPETTENDSNYITVKSPMIGTFYRSTSPDKPPFVAVGDTIAIGDVICIVEAMKLFNEIESEISGTIVKVLVDDAAPVEYDTPLFLVDPS